MATLDVDAMLERYRERAASVKRRNIPPVEGKARLEFIEQAKLDFQDYAIIGDAEASKLLTRDYRGSWKLEA